MIYVNKVIGFLQAYPIVVLAIGILILLIFLYKRPKTFFVLAVVAVVIYLVFTIAEVGTKQKTGMIKKSTGPRNISNAHPIGM
jgi:ABC-type transport system involved in Fe-S cluster assembly fused permease/ATPase subunit